MLVSGRAWRKFRRNPLSVVGLVLVAGIVLLAVLAPFVTPYPQHAGPFVDFMNANRAPDLQYWLGTDNIGRDLLSRIIYGYRISLVLGIVVLGIATPVGVLLGLIAGYAGGWADYVIMRVTDMFLAVPPLVLAMAIMGMMEPTLVNGMIAVSAMWWPWYARLAYSMARSESREDYVTAAAVVGAGPLRILIGQILPTCLPTIFTKVTLDLGFVIMIASSLSFLGLGVQPPTPDLGSMVAGGAQYLPDSWWVVVFPALAILLAVLGFNLLGDGLRDAMDQRL
ncbi:MAG: ABC transporter permease [Rhizobiaceae bacterium]